MKRIFSTLWAVCCGLAFAWAQETSPPSTNPVAQLSSVPVTNGVPRLPTPPPSAPPQISPAELEKIAMPIALHPDPLIAIILPASVYPVEIVQAARFVKDTNNLPKVDHQPWDENVKAVAKFPALITQMDKDLAWTVELGNAFVQQPKALMDMIQSLRAKAAQAGTLQTTPQQVVTVTNEVVKQTEVLVVTNQVVQIQPSNPEVIYVPTYSPTVYYPPPAYVYDPYAPLVTFGVGMAMGAVIANNCDWHGGGVWVGPRGVGVWGGGHHGDVDVDVDRNVNVNQRADINRNVNRTTTAQSGNQGAKAQQQQKWQPNQSRMQTSGAASAQSREARGWGSGSSQFAQAQASAAQNPSAAPSAASRPSPPSASGGTRPSQPQPSAPGAAPQRPAAPQSGPRPSTPQQQPSASRPTPSAPASRPSGGQSVSRPAPQSSSAFSGVNSGGSAHNYASRGAASRGGGGARGGGGRR